MTRKRAREAAPIQVYLDRDEQLRLERLAGQLEASKSEVLRRGLLALERELLDPLAHPALRLIGLATAEKPDASSGDAARQHDAVLAESEEALWSGPAQRRGTRRRAR